MSYQRRAAAALLLILLIAGGFALLRGHGVPIGPLSIVIVEDTAHRTKHPLQARVIVAAEWDQYRKDGRYFDIDAKSPDLRPLDRLWVDRAGDDLPRLFLTDRLGIIGYEGRLPETILGMRMLLGGHQ
jgi:hypothetical protein